MLDVVARRHMDGRLWVVPSEQSWSSALPYDWKFSGPTATVPPLVRGLTEGAQHAAALRETAIAASRLPIHTPTSAVHVAQQGMPSTRDLAVALAARPVLIERPQRAALAPSSRPEVSATSSSAAAAGR